MEVDQGQLVPRRRQKQRQLGIFKKKFIFLVKGHCPTTAILKKPIGGFAANKTQLSTAKAGVMIILENQRKAGKIKREFNAE